MLNSNSLLVWSDVDDMQTIYLSSLIINSCEETNNETNQIEVDHSMKIPPELMEKIVCYLDGITLLKFKLLSKTCYDIVKNALKYNKLWRQICLNEIPNKYFIDLLNRQFNKYIPLDSLSEIQYERLYKHWLQWQKSVLNTTLIGEQNFLCLEEIKQIICYKCNILIIFLNHTCLFSLIKKENTTDDYIIKENQSVSRNLLKLFKLNPQPQTNKNGEELDPFISYHQDNVNACPLHNTVHTIHIRNVRDVYTGKLIDVDANIYTNLCCWVRESWYEWHSNIKSNINGHCCHQLSRTLFTSVVHGVIIGRIHRNSIIFHNMFKDLCMTVHLWLDHKYIAATAVYIYTNILFIGTQNGYLLAFRLKCWDDLINLKKENMLLETRLNIGQIVRLNIIDFKNIQAIIVATTASVFWFKLI
ncbi:F-box domain [Cinara cedri]|uniref:F-box domain n=1 Tax=Cinara cedri TaxID=506608 RepID=A0A5E4MKP0_9HEMI|nr:F-box domain [Cinara cedri]